ncbi:hypothetical protein [Absidia glauca]|uniref:Uncharacterized protein n=1 Tax=Absidia glauca TaxID=4829 RepID=A0A168KQJ0_ABSGL|nr:hypothetical protein [Absidia glauca]
MGSRKHHRDDSEDRDHRRSKKSKSSSSRRSESATELPSTIKPITDDDYFEKASEYRIWLKEKKKKYFNELDAKDARYYFKKFVKAWNRYELEDKYYQGINSAHVSSSDTTSYKWSFAENVDTDELTYIKDKVDSMTSRGGSSSSSIPGRRANVGPSLPPSSSKGDQVVPKLEGREAKLAEKRATNAQRRRERSPDVELNDQDIYGGGDDYKARLAVEQRNKERRQARFEERKEQRLAPIKDKLADYKAKEDQTMALFRKMAEEQRQRGGL